MNYLDYFVVGFYLLGMVGVGLLFSKKNKSASDMFSAGGQSPWWASGLSAYMTMFSAGTFVVWGGVAFQLGAVAIAINCCYGIAAFVVGYFVAAKWKRLGIDSPAQFIRIRFGENVVRFYSWAMLIFRMIGTAVALYALAVVLITLMPLPEGHFLADPATGNLSASWAIVIFGGVVVAYTMLGGLWAVLMTDVLQFIVLTLAVMLLVPLILSDIGGWQSFVQSAPSGFFNLVSGEFSYYFLLGWILIHIFMIGADWSFVQRFISVPTEQDAKKSAYLFGALYLVSPFLWMLPPMIYRVIQSDVSPEQAYIMASAHTLPPGMIGLMVAAMFSATASLVSSQLNVFAGVLTDSIKFKGLTEVGPVVMGRVYTCLLGVVLMGIALAVPYLGGAESVIISITSLLVGPMMAPTLFGLLGRRITANSIWITVGTCFVFGALVKFALTPTGWLSNVAVFSALIDLIATAGRMVDIVLGVALPLNILTILHLVARVDASDVNAFAPLKLHQNTVVKASRDPLPLQVVMFAMGSFTVLFCLVGLLSEQKSSALFVFALMTAVIAAVLYFHYRSQFLVGDNIEVDKSNAVTK